MSETQIGAYDVLPPVVMTTAAAGASGIAPGSEKIGFHEVLSALNPLQYLPVVGTIYRAATGDTIPEELRQMGSVVVGGLVSGPVGLLTAIAGLTVQKATGIDMDRIGQAALHGMGLGDAPAAVAAAPAVEPAAAPADAVPGGAPGETVPEAARVAWSAEQLGGGGPGGAAPVVTAELLNGMELSRVSRALAAYARAPA